LCLCFEACSVCVFVFLRIFFPSVFLPVLSVFWFVCVYFYLFCHWFCLFVCLFYLFCRFVCLFYLFRLFVSLFILLCLYYSVLPLCVFLPLFVKKLFGQNCFLICSRTRKRKESKSFGGCEWHDGWHSRFVTIGPRFDSRHAQEWLV